MSSSTDPLDHFIRATAQTKKISPTEPVSRKQRWLTGLCLGFILGLCLALTSQGINAARLVDLPVFFPPLGFAGNFIALILWGLIAGMLTAFWQEASNSIGLAILFTAIALHMTIPLSSLSGFAQGLGIPVWLILIGTIITSFLFLLPVFLLIRGAIDEQADHRSKPILSKERLRLASASIIVIGVIGFLSCYPDHVLNDLHRMNRLISKGFQAQKSTELPGELKQERVLDFINNAKGNFTIEWNQAAIAEFTGDPYWKNLTDEMDNPAAITARFENGYKITCLYSGTEPIPGCQSR